MDVLRFASIHVIILLKMNLKNFEHTKKNLHWGVSFTVKDVRLTFSKMRRVTMQVVWRLRELVWEWDWECSRI